LEKLSKIPTQEKSRDTTADGGWSQMSVIAFPDTLFLAALGGV
jgi:hypothetical protein